MHFSQSKSTKCEIFAWNCDYSGTAYCRDLKPVALDVACLKPQICATQAISMHFSQLKSTKCEMFAWKLFRNCLLQRLETCGIGMPQTPNMCHSSHFYAFFPVKKQNVKFWLFPKLPLIKNWRNVNLCREKVFTKACKSAHIGFWVCLLQCTMLELCVTSTFWVIMVFLHFYGKVKI